MQNIAKKYLRDYDLFISQTEKAKETISCEVINTLQFDTGTDAFHYAEIKKEEIINCTSAFLLLAYCFFNMEDFSFWLKDATMKNLLCTEIDINEFKEKLKLDINHCKNAFEVYYPSYLKDELEKENYLKKYRKKQLHGKSQEYREQYWKEVESSEKTLININKNIDYLFNVIENSIGIEIADFGIYEKFCFCQTNDIYYMVFSYEYT